VVEAEDLHGVDQVISGHDTPLLLLALLRSLCGDKLGKLQGATVHGAPDIFVDLGLWIALQGTTHDALEPGLRKCRCRLPACVTLARYMAHV
jgi:hypothetical protein